jgi:hypothetical protein
MVDESLIPTPPAVRERLADSLEEARLLRRLLRISERFAERRHRRICRNRAQNSNERGAATS